MSWYDLYIAVMAIIYVVSVIGCLTTTVFLVKVETSEKILDKIFYKEFYVDYSILMAGISCMPVVNTVVFIGCMLEFVKLLKKHNKSFKEVLQEVF